MAPLSGFRINAPALDEARGVLAVKRRVMVESALRLPKCDGFQVMGTYGGLDPYMQSHRITLLAHQPTKTLHALLLHELVHAAQVDREGSHARFCAEYDRQLAEVGLDPNGHRDDEWYRLYQTIPFEREAYYVQGRAHEFTKIVRRKAKNTAAATRVAFVPPIL